MKFDILHTFISPVTGRILSTPNYVLLGDRSGVALPSPALIDLRLDLINLRRGYGILSNADVVVGTPNDQLPNAQVLSSLNNGYMFNTGGVVSTVPGGDIPPSLAKYVLNVADPALPNAQSLEDVYNSTFPIPIPDDRYILKIDSHGIIELAALNQDYITKDYLYDHVYDKEYIDDNFYTSEEVDGLIDDVMIELEGEIAILEGEIILAAAAAELAQGTADAALAVATGASATAATALGLATDAENRLDNLKLNEIPVNGNVSLQDPDTGTNYKIINLEDPEDPADAANMQWVLEQIGGVPGSTTITLEGDVIGSGLLSSPVATTLTLTLDEIPLAEDTVDLSGQRIKNLQQSPDEDFDAISATFLWDLMHDRVEILWP